MSTQDSEEGLVLVQLPSGANYPVHEEEVEYFQERADLYLKQNHFTNISDLQDVDRMLILELMTFRWGTWMSRQRDWWGAVVDVNEVQKSFKEYSMELRLLKKTLGIDKVGRDRQKGEESLPAYIGNLLIRAKEFGVMRESQLAKALELFQQLAALVTLHRNTDEVERREMHVTADDIIDWLAEFAIPEFNTIDEYFRKNAQGIWIRKM